MGNEHAKAFPVTLINVIITIIIVCAYETIIIFFPFYCAAVDFCRCLITNSNNSSHSICICSYVLVER